MNNHNRKNRSGDNSRKTGRCGLLLTAASAPFLLLAFTASAQIVPQDCRQGGAGCTLCHLAVLTNNLTNFLTTNIAFPAAALLIVIAGLVIVTAGASENRIRLGKTILKSAIIGLIIVMLAWLGVDTLIKILTNRIDSAGAGQLHTQWGPWNRVPEAKLRNCPL